MTENTDTTEKYPHVTDLQRDIVARYGEHLNNTGGNDPLDLLNRLANPKSRNLATTNIVVFTLAVSVQSQVGLLAHLEREGILTPPSPR